MWFFTTNENSPSSWNSTSRRPVRNRKTKMKNKMKVGTNLQYSVYDPRNNTLSSSRSPQQHVVNRLDIFLAILWIVTDIFLGRTIANRARLVKINRFCFCVSKFSTTPTWLFQENRVLPKYNISFWYQYFLSVSLGLDLHWCHHEPIFPHVFMAVIFSFLLVHKEKSYAYLLLL